LRQNFLAVLLVSIDLFSYHGDFYLSFWDFFTIRSQRRAGVDKAVLKKECNEKIRPSEFLDYREYLEARYLFFKTHNPRYTYFEYAEDSGLGHNNLLNALIRGRRPLTPKTCKKLIVYFGLVGKERQYFEALVEHSYARDPVIREQIFRKLVSLKGRLVVNELDRLQLEFFSHWSHAVLLELMNCTDSSLEPEWFRERIRPKLSSDEIKSGLELLCRIGYARKNETLLKYEVIQADISTGAEVESVALVRYHQTLLDLARSAVTDCAPEEREINSLVLTVTSEEFQLLKEKIQEISQQIYNEHPGRSDAVDTQVVQVSMQVFPLTISSGGKK
jgi:uncharacterized protein (TIGR02147 family)